MGLGQYVESFVKGVDADVAKSKEMDKYIRDKMDYKFPEEELSRRLNMFGQQMTAQEQMQMRQFQESFAGRTGGRMSSNRGSAEIGGQNAMARATGSAQLMIQAFNQELQQREAGLNAYIQKYGMDKQAQLAYEQLKQQKEQMKGQMFGDIFGSLLLLPFLLGGGSETT